MIKKEDIRKVINEVKKRRRDEEISLYGKPIIVERIERNKKKYTRKIKHKKLEHNGIG